MATVIPDLTPADLLGRFRGTITAAAPGYPEVLHLNLKDAAGDEWTFSTSYAEYSPSDPEFFLGKTVVDVDFERSGRLTMRFSDDSEFNVWPEPEEPDDDLATWHLITPEGQLALWFRPRDLWDISLGSDVA
jgi:hypothetical protein